MRGPFAAVMALAGLTACRDTVLPVVEEELPPECAVYQPRARMSGTMRVGRSDALTGELRRAPDGPQIPPDVELKWTSSNTAVLDVVGELAVAVAPGNATLALAGCGKSDTLSVVVVQEGYAVTQISPLPSGGTNGGDLSAAGHVVGTVGAAGTPGSQSFLWANGAFTDLGDCVPVAVNASDQVLCSGSGPRIWENGAASARDTVSGETRTMNDAGWVVFAASDPALWTAPGSHTRRQGVVGFGSMNSHGEVAGTTNPPAYGAPVIWRADETTYLSFSGRGGSAASLNDNGDVVGAIEAFPSANFAAAIWTAPQMGRSLLRGGVDADYNDIARGASDINNHRVVVGSGSRGAFVWNAGRLSLLDAVVDEPGWSFTSARRINDAGQILAQGTKGTYAGTVLLTPP